MKSDKRWILYTAAAIIALLIAAAILSSRSFWTLSEPADIAAALCDAFFVPGILYTSFGILILVADNGFFDIFSYGFNSLLTLFTPFRGPDKQQKYYEFKMEKQQRRKKPQHFLLHVGAIFLALAGICLLIYSSI